MAEYVILLHGDTDRWWNDTSDDERAATYAAHEKFAQQLVDNGHEITGGAELHPSSRAKRIPAGGGDATDGPFAELTEQLGGFYQVKSDDLDDLLDCCQLLAALDDTVTVIPAVTDEERAG